MIQSLESGSLKNALQGECEDERLPDEQVFLPLQCESGSTCTKWMGLQHLRLQMPRELIARKSKKVVKDYLNGKGSFQTLCEKYHLRSPELVNRWVKSYNGHKDSKKNSGGFSLSRAKAVFIPPAELVVVARSSYPKQKTRVVKPFG